MQSVVRSFAGLASDVRARPANSGVRLVGIDGCGGAGKTTFAARLARELNDAPVVHTDDFASFDEPVEWWPRFLTGVVEPLTRGKPSTFHPYDWVQRRPSDDTITIPPAVLVLVEGVGATRKAWRDRLAMRIWVDTPRAERLRRGLDRDGEHMRAFWEWWMVAEDGYVDTERPWAAADVVVDGATEAPSPDEYVELTGLSAPR